jgi:ATP-dependent RNA helicase DeaD
VHRIGRTGRAGRSGIAISFVAGREIFQIRHIERFTNHRIQRGRVPTLEEVDEARENVFLDKVRTTLQGGEFKRQDTMIERLLEEGHSSTDIASALFHLLQAGEDSPTKPAREEVPARPPRPERPAYAERAPYQDRRPAERYESRPPRREAEFEERPRVPVSERIIPPKRPASKPAVQIAPPKPKPAPVIEPVEAVTPPAAGGIAGDEAQPAKPSRKTPEGQTRLYMNIGSEAGVVPIDIVNSIAGETGLPGKIVGKVDVRERHLFVDVAAEHVNAVVAKLNRAEIKGRKVKLKVA